MRSLLICHEGASLNRNGIARWLASFSTLGEIVILPDKGSTYRRVKAEVKRIGIMRLFDAVAFRIYYKLVLSGKDRMWQAQKLRELCSAYPPVPEDTPVLYSSSPNTPEVEQFLRQCQPDLMIARCKVLLKKNIFSVAGSGTFVMHPGICPQYRNAHGCFWALANNDLDNVGMTLLKIDEGIDTGPVYGFYQSSYDELRESHVVIQFRMVLDSLDDIRDRLLEIDEGSAQSIDTTGRRSAVWGQPWLTAYLRWKYRAKRRKT